MKKNYFMKTFNLSINLMIFSILALFLGLVFQVLNSYLVNFSHEIPVKLVDSSLTIDQKISNFFFSMGILFSLTSLVFVTPVIIFRFSRGSLLNYFKSVHQTFSLRRFLYQSECSERILETQKKTKSSPINDNFNRTVKKAVVDIQNYEVLVFLQVPYLQQSQKILMELEGQIKEEISNLNPEYIFSNIERIGHKMWLKGTRR